MYRVLFFTHQGLGYSKTFVSGQYACVISLTYAMMSGDGPVARDLVAQAGSLRTLVMVGDHTADLRMIGNVFGLAVEDLCA